MLCAIFAILFGLSLLPGRKPLCLRFAERISDGILPDGAGKYCLTLTWVWFSILAVCAAVSISLSICFAATGAVASLVLSGCVVPITFIIEGLIRKRRFSVVFYTSGSTSKPKEIVKTFDSLAKEVAFHKGRFQISPQDTTFLATIEPNHMYGTLWRRMLPEAVGCKVDPEIILAPETLLEKMKSAKKVFFITTPTFLRRFCAYADQYEVPRNCVEIITSGALLDAETSAAAKRVFGIAPQEIFGSTETGGVAWRRQGETSCEYDWSVFSPVSVSLNAEGRLVVVRSPFSFRRGYVMGDGAELSPDARSFKLLGRKDRIVKIAEQRISLPDMEERIRTMDGIDDVALVALEREKGLCLGAVIATKNPSLKSHDPQSVFAMRRLLLPVFPRGSVPRRFRFVTELPCNPQGKVLVSEMKRLLESDDF